jgi:hypothetical protein
MNPECSHHQKMLNGERRYLHRQLLMLPQQNKQRCLQVMRTLRGLQQLQQ